MPKHKPLWLLLAVAAFALAAPVAADSEATRAASLVVDVSNVPNDKGQVGCSLYDKKEGFPSNAKKAKATLFVVPKGGKATCAFEGVKPGRYAVSVMHDEDKDGELETSMVGRPKEWWGVSNNVPAERFGPPKYEAATFELTSAPKTIRIKLQL